MSPDVDIISRPPPLAIAEGLPPPGCALAEARLYTRRLARRHYENFHLATWLLPARLRPHFHDLYAYCRWADDLADEIPDRAAALDMLRAWEDELVRCLAGQARHPVFVALQDTIQRFGLPPEPFQALLQAFRQDQTVVRYPDWPALLDYCRRSADPVGRLVLGLCGYSDARRTHWSDCTCTALQLANFWQDVSRDLEKGRIYIPMDLMALHGVSQEDILRRRFTPAYAALMRELVERTRRLFQAGLPLAGTVELRLRVDIQLFSRGGLAVLAGIERAGYDTLKHRPRLGPSARMVLLARALMDLLAGTLLPRRAADQPSNGHAGHP